MSEKERLSGPDNAWLRLGERTNQMVITGVIVFDDPVEFDALRKKFEENLLPFDRFKQRIVYDVLGRPKWEIDEEFALESHLHHVALPEPQDKETFEEFVAGQMATQLHPDMPLWQAHLVEGAGDGNALVIRVHHSLGDGFAMIYLLLGLADDPSEINLPIGTIPEPPNPTASVADGGVDASSDASSDAPGVVDQLRGAAHNGSKLLGNSKVQSMVSKTPGTLYDLLTMPDEPDTSLVGELGVPKRVAWTDRIDLDIVRAIGEEYDGTINDVLLTATTGGFRRYLEQKGELHKADDLRVAVPVNLKALEDRTEDLGNYFGLVYLQLPVGLDSPEARLKTIKERMDELKGSPEALLTYGLLLAGGNLPRPMQDLIAQRFRDTATAVVTNVPGPTKRFQFAGKEVSDILFWVPQSQGVGIGLSILSYDGAVRIGVASDAKLVSEPEELAQAMQAELESLASSAE